MAGVTAALALLTASAAASGFPAPSQADRNANEPAAQADVNARLSALGLPPGAMPSASEPAGDGGYLSGGYGGGPVEPVVGAGGWWVVPGTPGDVMAYLLQHEASGASSVRTGMETPGRRTLAIDWLATGAIWNRMLQVAVAELPSGVTGIRADAWASWITRRESGERVSAGAKLMTVQEVRKRTLRRPDFTRQVVSYTVRRLTVSAPDKINPIVGVVNALPVLAPPEPCNTLCTAAASGFFPPPPPIPTAPQFDYVLITLYRHLGAQPLAVVRSGGFSVELTIRGRRQPLLSSTPYTDPGQPPGPGLFGRLSKVLGLGVPGVS